jgi:nucleoid DNA-binding protein
MKNTAKKIISASTALTKHDVVMKLNSETRLTQPEAAVALQLVLDTITESLASGGHVEFRDFGVFEVVTRKSRIGRNPNKPEDTVEIPERKVVKFKPSKKMKALILGE